MDVGSKSPGLDSPEVICLSDDDSEAPPSVHHDDAEDVEDGTATGEAQDRIVDQLVTFDLPASITSGASFNKF